MSWARVAVSAGAFLVLAIVALRLAWPALVRHVVYPGGTLDPARRHPSAWGLETADEVRLETADGVGLHAWWIPAASAAGRCGTAIYFHGNAESIATRAWVAERLSRLGVDVLLFDYRGYGLSEGQPSEEGLREDARAAWSFAVEEKATDPEHLVLIGHSLGSAVATELALDRPAAGLVLGSPFPGMPAVFRAHAPWLTVPLMGWQDDRYEAGARIGAVRAPILVLAGEADRLIPTRLTRAVFGAAGQPKRLVTVAADHDTLMGHRDTWRAIDAFLSEHVCPRSVAGD